MDLDRVDVVTGRVWPSLDALTGWRPREVSDEPRPTVALGITDLLLAAVMTPRVVGPGDIDAVDDPEHYRGGASQRVAVLAAAQRAGLDRVWITDVQCGRRMRLHEFILPHCAVVEHSASRGDLPGWLASVHPTTADELGQHRIRRDTGMAAV
jgi:hypothetical protein